MIKADKFENKAITCWVNYYLKSAVIRRLSDLIRVKCRFQIKDRSESKSAD